MLKNVRKIYAVLGIITAICAIGLIICNTFKERFAVLQWAILVFTLVLRLCVWLIPIVYAISWVLNLVGGSKSISGMFTNQDTIFDVKDVYYKMHCAFQQGMTLTDFTDSEFGQYIPEAVRSIASELDAMVIDECINDTYYIGVASKSGVYALMRENVDANTRRDENGNVVFKDEVLDMKYMGYSI